MRFVRNVALPFVVVALAAGCGGKQKEAKSPTTPETSQTVADTASTATTAGTGHEGEPMAGQSPGTGATGATGGAGSTGETKGEAAPLSDEHILLILHLANTGEVELAKVAHQKTKNAKVKAFAAMISKDHTGVDTKGDDIAKKNKLTPQGSPISTTLKADSEKTLEQLKAHTGADFDLVYIQAQVKTHQSVLDIIDTKLMPNAKNAELKAMLIEIRPKIEAHLKEAQAIQQSLSTTK